MFLCYIMFKRVGLRVEYFGIGPELKAGEFKAFKRLATELYLFQPQPLD